MNSISKFLEKKLLPIATVVANNTYIQVLSQTFISLIPIIIIGAFSLILSKAPIQALKRELTGIISFWGGATGQIKVFGRLNLSMQLL